MMPNIINWFGHPGSHPHDYTACSITITRTSTISRLHRQGAFHAPQIPIDRAAKSCLSLQTMGYDA
jgi:hypothetical protein